RVTLACGLLLGWACNQEPSESQCGDGREVTSGGESHCIYDDSLIIEGFRCPEGFPSFYEVPGGGVCSQDPDLSDVELGEITTHWDPDDDVADARADVRFTPDLGPDLGPDLAPDVAGDSTRADISVPSQGIHTPEQTDDFQRRICGLDNAEIIAGALRAGACLDAPVAGILEDAARGLVFGRMLTDGYGSWLYGNCEFLSCLAFAQDCEEAEACNEARYGHNCLGDDCARISCSGGYRCDGSTLQLCEYDQQAEDGFWVDAQNCRLLSAECQETTCTEENCWNNASCVRGNEVVIPTGGYGECLNGEVIRPFDSPGGPGVGLTERIQCDQLAEGATCSEVSVGGEVPGPMCLVEEPECDPQFGDSTCNEDGTISLCLYGEYVSVDCADYGYRACDGQGFYTTRCVY
ncbi:MAG: hypothetical protein KC561_17200, partial [Myxococcales bacterium]|nr:hypothetical protein [Myxococcales bacterium]